MKPQYSYRTMYLNIVLFYPTLLLGGYLLQNKSMVLSKESRASIL